MNRLTALSLVLVALVGSSPVGASEQSKQLTARGLEELHAEHLEQARDLLDQAVLADPEDIYALYYRGVVRARLRKFEGATHDFEKVLAARPDLDDAALDLGIALLETEKYREAIPWLEQARAVERLAPRASLFLGVARLRLADLEAARGNFERAAASPEERLTARYYLGVVEYQTGDSARAKEHFSYVVETDADSSLGHEAAAFLDLIKRSAPRSYKVYGSFGFQYDSNVILAPSQDSSTAENVLGVSHQADGRAVIAAGGVYVPWSNDDITLSVAYDFYQSLHFDLHEFNLQDHGPSLQISGKIAPVQLGLLSRYDYYLLETDSFLQQATVVPWASIPTGDLGRTSLFYEMRWQDYKQLDYKISNGVHHTLGIRQLVFLGSTERYLSLGYQFERQDPIIDDHQVNAGVFTKDAAKALAYDGDQVEARLVSPLIAAIEVELVYAYRHERYLSQSEMFSGPDDTPGPRRRDDEHIVIVGARRPLMEHLDVIAAYLGEFNNSKDPDYEFNRHIVSLSLEARF